MARDVENDIDTFIQQQKHKLAQERHDLEQDEPVHERKTWDKPTNEKRPTLAEEPHQAPTPETGLPIGRNSYEARRKKLQEERRKEYNELLLKKSPAKGPRRLPTPNGRSLPVGGGQDSVTDRRKALQEERSREYNKMLAQSPKPVRPPKIADEGGLPVGQYAEQKKKLEDERIKEYNEFLQKNPPGTHRQILEPKTGGKHVHFNRNATDEELQQKPIQHQPYPYSDYEHSASHERLNHIRNQEDQRSVHQHHHDLSRVRDPDHQRSPLQDRLDHLRDEHYYQRTVRQKQHEPKRVYDPYDESPLHDRLIHIKDERSPRSVHLTGDIHRKTSDPADRFDHGSYEYRQTGEKSIHPSQKNFQSSRKENLPPKPATPDTFLSKLGGHDREKKKLDEERKKEYNQLLQQKAARGEKIPGRGGETLGVPGLDDRLNDQKHEGRNPELSRRQQGHLGPDENSSWLQNGPPSAPRKGWATPTYEEILQKKQQEENRYRRYDDPELTRPNPKLTSRDRDLYGSDPSRTNRDKSLLEDGDWLRPERMKNDLYNAAQQQQRPQQSQAHYIPRPSRPDPSDHPQATLLIGHEETSSAKRRKKESYRHELEQQIQEHLDAKKWERDHDWRVNATGFFDPEKDPDRLRGLPLTEARKEQPPRDRGMINGDLQRPLNHEPPLSQRIDYQHRSSDINPYLNALDSLSSRTDAILERRPDLGYSGGGTGILDRGWEGLIDRPRQPIRTQPPPGYENSTYLSRVPDYGSVNEAYHLSGLRNPLESYNDIPSTTLDAAPTTTRVQFDEPSSSPRKTEGRRSVLPFPVEEPGPVRTKQKKDTQSYQAELQKQIEEQRLKKKREKEEQERLDRKWEEENKNYNPFGRGGGGAPIKDSQGQTLADLRHLRINEQDHSPTKQSPRGPPQPVSPRLVAKSPPPNQQGESTYARGGHGIFGVPKTYEEKTASDKYKDDLRQQIEDKRRREAEERERLRQEEERENQRLEEQQRRIQHEFEEEQRRKMEKEEEARRKNEEIRKLTEEKRKQAEEQRKEQEERKLQELRERQEEERKARERELQSNADRPSSPPVPAVKSKRAMDEDSSIDATAMLSHLNLEQRGNSPVVPALRKNSAPAPPKTQQAPDSMAAESRPPRASSADVLNQLAAMRRQLQTERARVENALDHQKNDYEVYDPRLVVQRPPSSPAT
ncbi:centrosome and spindle pole-associated protein 1-like isoform X2 [Liolophura sinensis]|uniref:centrosome and spindle pole-associated protein 1-like isoform X2 n=1 Tax=Liolophura sinensis TaxID=3198878 RepID=UPI0031581A4E